MRHAGAAHAARSAHLRMVKAAHALDNLAHRFLQPQKGKAVRTWVGAAADRQLRARQRRLGSTCIKTPAPAAAGYGQQAERGKSVHKCPSCILAQGHACSDSSSWYVACGRLATTPITPLMVPYSTVGMADSSARRSRGHAKEQAQRGAGAQPGGTGFGFSLAAPPNQWEAREWQHAAAPRQMTVAHPSRAGA